MDSDQRTYHYLIHSMERYIERTQWDINQKSRRAQMQRAGGGLQPVMQAGGASAGGGKKPCFFHNHGGCKNKESQCKFAHTMVSDTEKALMERPVRREGRSPSPKGEKTANKTPNALLPCRQFLKGNCKRGEDCCFAHVDQTEADRMAKARPKAEAKAKAKAKAEAKAASCVPVGLVVPTLVPARSE